MNKRIWVVIAIGTALVVIVSLVVRDLSAQKQLLLSDGRLFHLEAATFGTNHVVAFDFDSPVADVQAIGLEVVVLEPLHAEFVVCPSP